MTFNKSLWSRKHEKWNTPNGPEGVFTKLNDQWKFQLDAASSKDNPLKTPYFYTELDDGLTQEWRPSTFFNPPFTVERMEGDKRIRTNVLPKWVSKAQGEAEKGNYSVGLFGSRTGTGWAQDVCFKYCKLVCFVRGRLHFSNAKNSAPFDSVLFYFTNRDVTNAEYKAFKIAGNNGATFFISKKTLTRIEE